MEIFILCFELIGTFAFALSGAITGLQKRMDILGVCVLGLTTAVGGGITRDLILGITPPSAFRFPVFLCVALSVSILVFIPWIRRHLFANGRFFELLLLWTDSAGLGIFTVCGVQVAMISGHGDNAILVLFVAVLTGVGGGVLRDIFAGDRPYIFIKHFYACAALSGAVVCYLPWQYLPSVPTNFDMIAGFAVVLVLRICAAHFHWSLPKSEGLERD